MEVSALFGSVVLRILLGSSTDPPGSRCFQAGEDSGNREQEEGLRSGGVRVLIDV